MTGSQIARGFAAHLRQLGPQNEKLARQYDRTARRLAKAEAKASGKA